MQNCTANRHNNHFESDRLTSPLRSRASDGSSESLGRLFNRGAKVNETSSKGEPFWSQGILICNVKYSHSNVSVKQDNNETHEEVELLFFGNVDKNVNYSVRYSDVCITIKEYNNKYDRDENGKYALGVAEVLDECLHIKLFANKYLINLLIQQCDQADPENIFNTIAIIALAKRIDNWNGEEFILVREFKFSTPRNK